MRGSLSHLRVIDCTDVRGALAARILADLGADVLKVEIDGGDVGRQRGPFAGGVAEPDRALPFLYRNANKRGLTLGKDLAAASSRLDALCASADVVIENFERARAASLGLEPPSGRSIRI